MKQSDIVKKIRKLGYKVTVLNASARNRGGIPDVLISDDGYPIFVEIKIDDDEVSKLQQDFIDEFFRMSCVLHWYSDLSRFVVEQITGLDEDVFETMRKLMLKLNAL